MQFFFNEPNALTQSVEQRAEKATPKSKHNVNIFWTIISKARKGFDLCLSEFKSNDMKLAYLRNSAKVVSDVQVFFNEYMALAKNVADQLADRVSVKEFCEKANVDLQILATHVVFMGKTKMAQVLRYGVGEQSPIHGRLNLFNERFLPDDPQEFVDNSWKPSEHQKEVA